jgi:hypothetical protein
MSDLKRICFYVALSLVTLSCKHDGVGPDGGNSSGFSVKLSVVSATGQPVKGLQISVSNSESPLPVVVIWGPQKKSPQNVAAVTSVSFDAPVSAHINFMVFDLDGAPVSTLMSQDVTNPGKYQFVFSVPHSYGTRVYKVRLIAADPASGVIMFRDSIYAVLWNIDPSPGIIGYTSSAGTYQTQDSLLFPNVLNLRPLILTNANSPDQIGTFYIPDTVNVVLADTVARQSQTYVCSVQSGANDIHLVWAPSSGNQPPGARPQPVAPLLFRPTTPLVDAPPITWKLYQNYPNPFN